MEKTNNFLFGQIYFPKIFIFLSFSDDYIMTIEIIWIN